MALRSRELPRALALALEPKVERAISLQIADFLDQVPAEYAKPVEVLDSSRSVELKASEIEKGMPEKNPTISLPSLFQQVPEIFLRSVPPTDPTRIALPYDKVLEQFNNARVRADQARNQRVPQLDTPILQATLEDNKRFGTKIEPLESSELPPVLVEPATAETIATAEPEAVASEKVGLPSSKSISSPHPVISLHGPDLQPVSKKDSPSVSAKISFHLPPNGTGAPASERVPASSGPPVPTTLPAPAEPAPIPFGQRTKNVDPKISATPMKSTAGSGPDRDATLAALEKDGPKIALALKPLLQNLPAFQLNGDASAVPDDVRLQFSLSLIEPQLAGGRVAVPAKTFQQAIPQMYRQLFVVDASEAPVSLPLEEVLRNLPAAVLKLRDDQEQLPAGKDFETPFSIKAREDAERLDVRTAPVSAPSEKPAPEQQSGSELDIKGKKQFDAKQVAAQASRLSGVTACAITFSDGLSLAGNLPPEIAAGGLCAIAPSMLQKLDQHMRETTLGLLTAMTLYSANSGLTFFAKGNICLTALHDGGSLASQTRAQLAELVEKLSRTYAQPETSHVNP